MTSSTSLSTTSITSTPRRRAVTVGRVAIGGTLLAAGTGGLTLLAQAPASAIGTTYTVANTNDSGVGSLRQAILDANANAGADTIVFSQGVTGTINLAARLDILEGVTIQGPGSASLSISGQNTLQMFYLYANTGGAAESVAISGLTLTDAGGASAMVCWQMNLALDDVKILNSTVVDSGLVFSGSGGLGDASLTITNSEISDITNTGSGKPGGAVDASGGTNVTISNSTFSGNTAQGNGGAIRFTNTGDVTISNSTFSGNTSIAGNPGGGALEVENDGNFTMTNSTVHGNTATGQLRGGGIFFASSGGVGKTITIANSTIDGNTAGSAAGLYFRTLSAVSINNSTISGNSAVASGGGIMAIETGSLTINQSTITGNASAGTNPANTGGAGILTAGVGSLNLSGTILSGNTSGVAAQNDLGLYNVTTLTNFTANASLLGTIDSRATVAGANNVNSTSPNLGALANNGGSTQTRLPLSGSPAIDAGPNPVATFSGNGFDQRGTPYVRISNNIADIGAIEVQSNPPPTTASTSTSTSTSSTTPSSTAAPDDTIDPGTEASAALPSTGSDALPLVTIGGGVLILGAGAAAVAASRRRLQQP